MRACAEDGGPLEQAFLEQRGGRQLPRRRAATTRRATRRPPRAWDELGRPYRAARALWRQAEALVAEGDREAALEPVARRAGDHASGSAPRGSAASSRAWSRAAGCGRAATRTAPASAADDEPFGLTPRERQVLALVAAGATNREIGQQLYMAEKTASVHVSRILAKLDVRSRTEAAGVAHRLGLDAVA